MDYGGKMKKNITRRIKKTKRFRIKQWLLLCCVLCLMAVYSSSVWADSKPKTDTDGSTEESRKTKVRELTSMTVVGEQTTIRQDLRPDSLTNIYKVETSARLGTEVFTQQNIQDLKPKDLNDLIDKAAGIDVTYQGRKSPYHIRARGGGSFTYIIDGAVLPSSVNRILYKFPLASIEELKIVRGAHIPDPGADDSHRCIKFRLRH